MVIIFIKLALSCFPVCLITCPTVAMHENTCCNLRMGASDFWVDSCAANRFISPQVLSFLLAY